MSRFLEFLRNRTRSLGDRGVTLVEYALVVSLVVVGSMSSLDGLDGELEKHYTETATDIGYASAHSFDVPTTTVDPNTTTTSTTTSTTSTTTTLPASSSTSTTSTTTTSTTTTSTTTTAPPPTTSTSTTTTAPPATTTTTAPGGGGGGGIPTTTTVPGAHTANVTDSNWSDYYGDYWKWDVYGRLKFRNQWGSNLSYATVSYTITLATGEQQSFSGTTNNRGNLTVDWAFHDSSDVFPATITVTSVTKWGDSYNPSPAQFVWDAN